MRTKALTTALALTLTLAASWPASAGYWNFAPTHHARVQHWHHGHGHTFNCGRTQAAHFGLGAAFALALHWAILPHTSAHPGAVVVQRRAGRALGGGPGGHVSRIVRVLAPCRAIVSDNAGTYSRDICRNLVAYVQPR
jgi:hypothetical protein